MASVFIDVGSHLGQTLAEVTQPIYGFDRIYAFEPMPEPFAAMKRSYGRISRVTPINAGLAATAGDYPVYGRNMGASMFSTKRKLKSPSLVTPCHFLRATEFFAENIGSDESVFMKLNCEGAECLIMNDLIDSSEVWKLTNVMIDFDVRKVPGMEGDELALRRRMEEIGFDRYAEAGEVMKGETHELRIRNWLHGLPARDAIFAAPRTHSSLLDRLSGLLRRTVQSH